MKKTLLVTFLCETRKFDAKYLKFLLFALILCYSPLFYTNAQTGCPVAPSTKAISNFQFKEEKCPTFTEIECNEVENIGTESFSGCTSLKSVSMPNAITISNGAFYECHNLENVSFPNVKSV
ncbi:MAG: leucine-rich repeat domain-containing protein, partial [Bacteroidetes bacterium]|nr:leucine-rich repeat domain-containing protein [Bacteroidota bacterium]